MRILHIFDHSLPLQSGYVTRSLGIISGQRARGWQTIHLTTPRQGSTVSGPETINGLTFNRTARVTTRSPILREFLEIAATRRELKHLVERERPDILHAHSPVLNVLPALSVARRFRLPVVYEVRALWEDAAVDHGTAVEGGPRYRATRLLDTWAMSRVDAIAPICEPLRQEIASRGVSATKLFVVPNAVSRELLSDQSPTEGTEALQQSLGVRGRMVIGFIGSFYAYEGLDLLLRATKQLSGQRSDILVLLVGGGPEERRLKQLAVELELEDFVRFVGRVDHTEVPKYYAMIDLLVFPRRKMRLTDLVTPLKPLEAMAQRKAVLASDVGGHRELISDGRTGFLFPAGDVAALTASLERLANDVAGRERVASQGQQFVRTERAWDNVVDRYAQIYDWLSEQRRYRAAAIG